MLPANASVLNEQSTEAVTTNVYMVLLSTSPFEASVRVTLKVCVPTSEVNVGLIVSELSL